MALGDPYVSAAELKAYMRIGDTQDDVQIAVAVAAGTDAINDFCRRQFNVDSGVSTRVFRPAKSTLALVDDFSTVTGLIVKTGSTGAYNTTLVIDTDYLVEPLNESSGHELPIGDEAGALWRIRSRSGGSIFTSNVDPSIEVTALWGWSAVPQRVVQATYIMSARYLRRRESPEGIIGGFEDVPIRVGTKTDPDVVTLLNRLRKHRRGGPF